jgi:hypothetical protein
MENKDIINAYKHYKLVHGKSPASVYLFMQELQAPESSFYEYFNSFDVLEKEIWNEFYHETIHRLHQQEVYHNYSAREKLLAFYYTAVEVFKENRSYVLICFPTPISKRLIQSNQLDVFKVSFLSYAQTLLNEGISSQEVIKRPYISEQYNKVLWLQFLFVLKYWLEDESKNFEKTDAAIEKAVNLSFDLMGHSILDSMLDFGKFILQK